MTAQADATGEAEVAAREAEHPKAFPCGHGHDQSGGCSRWGDADRKTRTSS